MDVSAVVLNKLLSTQNIEIWSKLKLAFLDPAYSGLYSAIARHYDTYGKIPSFNDLEISLRDKPAMLSLATVKLAEVPDVDIEVVLDAVLDKYTQEQAVLLLEKFVDVLPVLDSDSIKEELNRISLALDEKTLTSETVYGMDDLLIFTSDEEVSRDRVYLGLNNTFDQVLGGVARQELILFGGYRGSGKSICCSNLQVNQFLAGNTSLYFTIEMVAKEVALRNMAIQAGVPAASLKKNTLTDDEVLKVVKARAAMFLDADDLVEEFVRTRDRFKFEQRLVREKTLHPTAQMIIVDDRALTLSSIDIHIGKTKARFGDSLRLVVVDYVNRVVNQNSTGKKFDWTEQVEISDLLKNLARKHDVTIASPYQIDASGEARFAKGILDAADIALLIEAHDKETKAVTFKTTKIRGDKEMEVTSGIDWNTLQISPTDIEKPSKKRKQKDDDSNKETESARDAPW